VQAWIEAAVKQLDEAKAAWEVKLKWSPSQPRWAAVAAALAQVADGELDRAVLESRWRITKQQGGAMAELLTAYEVYTAETDRIGAELKRLELAQKEIEAAL
jgi:hypothetical protein